MWLYIILDIVNEMVTSNSILWHILDNNIADSFPSAYKTDHGFTLKVCVHNDIVTTVEIDNGSFLVLLGMSTAFDMIDYHNLF